VGDQMFTDVLGGKLSGVKTIWLTLIKPEPMWSFRLRRWLEGKIIKLFKIEKTEE
jgi:predicted HAD superfamily phosphohydrolase YqeG